MKMFLTLAYCAFSSSPLKDATMRTFGGFSSFLLKFKPFDEFFPFQKVIANLSLWVVSKPRNRVTRNSVTVFLIFFRNPISPNYWVRKMILLASFSPKKGILTLPFRWGTHSFTFGKGKCSEKKKTRTVRSECTEKSSKPWPQLKT